MSTVRAEYGMIRRKTYSKLQTKRMNAILRMVERTFRNLFGDLCPHNTGTCAPIVRGLEQAGIDYVPVDF